MSNPKNGSLAPTRQGRLRTAVACATLCIVPAAAWTQAPPPEGAPSEAVRRQALGPYRMILQDAAAPAREKKVKPEAKASEARAEPVAAKRPAREAPPATTAASPAPAAPTPTVAAIEPPSPTLRLAPATMPPAAAPAAPEPPAAPAPATQVATANAKPAPAAPRPLVPVKQDPPTLPAALLREHPQGTVKVGFSVLPDGSTADVKVLATTNRKLNPWSVDAVSAWKFQPIEARRDLEIELVYKD